MTKQSPQRPQHPINDLITMPDDGKRNELINGEIVEVGTSSQNHSMLAAWLVWRIVSYVRTNKLGGRVNGPDGTYRLDDKNLRVPDVSYQMPENTAKLPPNTVFVPFAPDLAIVIRSPSQKGITMHRLAHNYLKAGTHLVWIVDYKDECVLVFHLDQLPVVLADEDTLDREGVLPGFTVKPSEIFAAISGIP